jgi:hypothetical protein
MINHSPFARAYIDAQKGIGMELPWEKPEDVIIVYADRAYKKFEQVFISYGTKSNAELLLLYGFALDRNPYNSVDLSVALSAEDDPMYAAKLKWLQGRGMGSDAGRATYPLYSDRFPEELLRFLRLACIDKEQLTLGIQAERPTDEDDAPWQLDREGRIASAAPTVYELRLLPDCNRQLSLDNEAMALTCISQACEVALARYPTSEEDDSKLIADRNMFGMLSRNARMAVRLRRTEKRLLKRTLASAESRILKSERPPAPKVKIEEAPWDWISRV